ncbi:MAG: PAS domain-containing protein [Planctomycetota bacterium]
MHHIKNKTTSKVAAKTDNLTETKSLLDAMSDIVVMLDQNAIILFANRSWSVVTGWPLSMVVGKPLWEFVHPMEEENLRSNINKAIAEGESLTGLESRLKTSEGTWRWVSLNGEVLSATTDERPCYLITGEENGEVEDLREQLASSEAALRSILNRMPVAAFAFNPEGKIVLWNQECGNIYNLSAGQTVGKMLWQTVAKREEAEHINGIVHRVFEGETLHGVEWHWQYYVDTSRNLSTIVYPVKGDDGQVILGVSVTLDVTHKRDFERDLRDETQFRTSVFEGIKAGIALIDLHGELLYANRKLHNTFNLGRSDVRRSLLRGQGESLPNHPSTKVLEGADSAATEITTTDRHGHPLNLKLVASPLCGPDGEMKGIIEVLVPLTEEEKETKPVNYHIDIFNNLSDPVALLGPDLKLIEANTAFLEMYAIRKTAAVGRPCHEILRRRSAPCNEECHGCPAKKAIETGKPDCIQYRFEPGNRPARLLEVSATPTFDSDHKVSNVVLNIRDITEREDLFKRVERAKQEWERIFDAMHDLVSIHDKDFTIIRANKALAGKLGLPVQKVIGRKCHEIFHNADRPVANCPAIKAMQTGRTFSEQIEDEELGSLFVCASPLMDSHGEIIGFVHVAHDLTEQKKLESQLRHAQRMESLGELAGGIAHDFNNLLGGILGYASFAKSRLSEDDRLHQEIQTIEQCALRASELTAQLLAFSRSDRPDRYTTSLKSVIGQVLKITKRTLGKSVSVHQDIADDLSEVYINEGQIQQAILNICINARDAMPDGGKITISARNITIKPDRTEAENCCETSQNATALNAQIPPGNYARLSISDTGTGVEPEVALHIFEPFFTTKERDQGTGLGLAMVMKTVVSHEGFITLESEPGIGSTFHIYLPKAAKPARDSIEQVTETPPGGTETILVVDDEEIIRAIIRQALTEAGYDVHVADSGADALTIFASEHKDIDLIILNVAMPGMNGAATFKKMREIDPSATVLVATGYAREGQALELLEQGANGFLQKPFSPAQLLRYVRHVLDHAYTEA